MTALAFTFFPRLLDAQGQRIRTTWPKLLERLSQARVVADKHDTPGLSLATYAGDRRAIANVERVFAVGLDLDKRVDWELLLEHFENVDSFLHTTWSSTSDAVRARVFIKLSRPVTAEEYRRCYRAVTEKVEGYGHVVDRAASDPSRFWFLPSIPPGGEYRYSIGRGKPINVEWALATVPPEPPPTAPPPPPSGTHRSETAGDVVARARAYLEKCEPAISGSGGHKATFIVAQKLVRGFALDEATAYHLICDWNRRCDPPWSERELRRKLQQAAKAGVVPIGALRDATRRAS